jgi:hypothetical protein
LNESKKTDAEVAAMTQPSEELSKREEAETQEAAIKKSISPGNK